MAMNLARCTFYFMVLISILCIVVEAHKHREFTEGFQGTHHHGLKTIMDHLKAHHIHPVYDAREFLSEHNKIRKELGEPPFKWDKKLAHYARRFAGQRAADCAMLHSQGPYGENIYWGADYHKHTAAAAVRAWAGENSDYNAMTNTCNPTKLCGHYKQIIWKTSTRLGCARVKCNNGGVYIICSYDPPGNFLGESPFDSPVVAQEPPPPSSTVPVTSQPITTMPVAQVPPAAPAAADQTMPANTPPAQTTTSVAQTKPTSPSTPS